MLTWLGGNCTFVAMKIQKTDSFPVSRQTFVYDIFLEESFNEALHDHLNFESRTVVLREETDDELRMRIEFIPGRELPGLLKKLAGGSRLGYVEELVLDKRAWRLDSTVTPMTLAERIQIRGCFHFYEEGPDRCRREYECTINVRLPVGSGLLAKSLAKSLHEDFAKARQFIERFIQENFR